MTTTFKSTNNIRWLAAGDDIEGSAHSPAQSDGRSNEPIEDVLNNTEYLNTRTSAVTPLYEPSAQNSSFTAAKSNNYQLTVSANMTITFPPSPIKGDSFRLKMIDGDTSAVVTLDGNGTNIGSVASQALEANYFNNLFVFDGTVWRGEASSFKAAGTGSSMGVSSKVVGNTTITNAQFSTVVPVQTSGTTDLTMTLPSSPAVGSTIGFTDYDGNWANGKLIITTTDNIEGSGDDLGISTPATIVLQYIDTTRGWNISSFTVKEDAKLKPIALSALYQAMIDSNRDKYAASGFVRDGKHLSLVTNGGGSVNEGLTVSGGNSASSLAGQIGLGFLGSSGVGSSKTGAPVIHIAGYLSTLAMSGGAYGLRVKLQGAPKGYDIYDSSGDARGSGKATLNLRTEQDPKYGDIASTDNEAIARAFEGLKKDGDFRSGTTAEWAIGSNKVITAGNCNLPNGVQSDVGNSFTWVDGVTYEVEFIIENKVGPGSVFGRVYGNINSIELENGSNKLVFTAPSSTGTSPRVQVYTSSDAGCDVKGIFVRPVTEEVVINRKDIYGCELFLEQVTTAHPHIYQNGMIQDTNSTSWEGITTTDSNRPDTYYAAYDGDTTSRGKGLDYTKLTFAQLSLIMSKPENNLRYMANGDLVQLRLRQRSIAGAGNGNWYNIDSNNPSLSYPDYIMNFSGGGAQAAIDTRVSVQGASDAPSTNRALSWYATTNASSANNSKPELGVFTAASGASAHSYNGECYFHVWGSVSRLNQGAYHPLNPMGSAYCKNLSGTQGNWYAADRKYNSLADCMTHKVGGDLESGATGRDDDKFYDAVYPSGQGGVIDDRLSAWDMGSPEEAAKFDSKVKSGVARGEHNLVFSKFGANTYQGFLLEENNLHARFVTTSSGPTGVDFHGNGMESNCPVMVFNAEGVVAYGAVSATNGYLRLGSFPQNRGSSAIHTQSSWRTKPDNSVINVNSRWYIVEMRDVELSVEGNKDHGFTVQDVVGNPSSITQTPHLSDGWYGYWIPSIPDGTNKDYPLSRKSISSSFIGYQTTTDNGLTWNNIAGAGIDTTRNLASTSLNGIIIWTYEASPYVTLPSTNLGVFNGEAGLGGVWAHNGYLNTSLGNLLVESLLGKVGTSSGTEPYFNQLQVRNYNLHVGTSVLESTTTRPLTHESVNLQSSGDSPAVKALMRQVVVNQGLHLGYSWSELKWNSTAPTTIDGTTTQSYVAGTSYLVTLSGVNKLLTCTTSVTTTFIELREGSCGKILSSTNDVYFEPIDSSTGSWGDDSTIRIIDGTGTFNNLNGDVCSYGSAITKRYGWTRNQARVGSQVEGVDL